MKAIEYPRAANGQLQKQSLMDCFMEYVIMRDGCWGWKGYVLPNGYACLAHRSAARASWRLFRGEIPKGLWLLHKCDNRICTNPDHLFLGNAADNANDCYAKGRYNSHQSKKTHCPYGHPYAGENLRLDPKKTTGRLDRRCKACIKRRSAERYQKKNILSLLKREGKKRGKA